MADAVVLDTSSILTLTGNEPGADEVQRYVRPFPALSAIALATADAFPCRLSRHSRGDGGLVAP